MSLCHMHYKPKWTETREEKSIQWECKSLTQHIQFMVKDSQKPMIKNILNTSILLQIILFRTGQQDFTCAVGNTTYKTTKNF